MHRESARKETLGLKYRTPAVAHAECVFEDDDGPLRLTQNQKESHRRSLCKHLLIRRLQILYRLWTLPFKLLTGVICVIVRRRSASPARALENSADQRFLMKMDAELLHSPVVGLAEEEEVDMTDWNLPLAFMKKRHTEKIEGSKALAQSWRMKDR
ncbi:hypothetical protein QQF64_028851, partial [Cirrhinus molitorella]